jgi:hypothetical protein
MPEEKTVGASTKARKIRPPSQTTSDNSIKNRRNDMSEIIEPHGDSFVIRVVAGDAKEFDIGRRRQNA